MRVKRIVCLVLIGAFLAGGMPVYPLESLSLDSMVEEARDRNPEIIAAKKRWEASQARVPMAKALDAPAIGFRVEKIPRGTIRLDRTLPGDRMLSISQFLPLFGKLSLKEKIAFVESQMFAADYKREELKVINEVKNAYFDLFLNDRLTELDGNNLEILKGVARTASAKYITGGATQETVFKINMELARLENEVANLKVERAAKATLLNILLNRLPEEDIGPPALSEDTDFHTDIHILYKMTIQNQPELLVFSYAIEMNKNEKALAQRNRLPDMMADLTLRGLGSGSAFGMWDIGLAFTMPFWFWTKQKYEVREAIANLEEAQAAYKGMENRAFAETKGLVSKIDIAKNKINLYRTGLIPLIEGNVETSISAFRSGDGDFMMLLDNLRGLIDTKMEYYTALVGYSKSLADLERNIGVELTGVKR